MDPDQTAPKVWVHTVCKNDFLNHKQTTKQTTIVVTGNLSVKGYNKTLLLFSVLRVCSLLTSVISFRISFMF